MSLLDIFRDVHRNWRFGGWPESKSGGGSTLENTEKIRAAIRQLVKDKQIKSVVDLPCGDFNWMKEIVYGFEKYIGCDIVPELIEENKKYSNSIIDFIELDATVHDIPDADLLIVRDLLGHLSLEDGKKVINNILNSNCKYLLSTTWYNIHSNEYHLTHVNVDNEVTLDKQLERGEAQFYPVCLMSNPFNFPEPEFYLEESAAVPGYDDGIRKVLGFWEIDKIKNKLLKIITPTENLTVVTGLWNIGREGRDFSHYIENFKLFLDIPVNLYIYIPQELEYLVWENSGRTKENTVVRILERDEIKNNYYAPFWQQTQRIRQNPSWYKQTGENGWLTESPQAKNEWYNPVVQSKMFMLHDAKVMNPFNTDYLIWLDAGITNTVVSDLLVKDRPFDNIHPFLDKFLFLSYPYEANTEIHGFDFIEINKFARQKVTYVCRGGLFGGHKDYISIANSDYYGLLLETLERGLMGTEESVFSIMAHRDPHTYRRFMLKSGGMIADFIQPLIANSVELEPVAIRNHEVPLISYKPDLYNTSLYVLSFNFPEQFDYFCQMLERNDTDWVDAPKRKILVNNSNDTSVLDEYELLCKKYNFEHIIMGDNLGINGGRQFVAEHFEESDSKYYIFFEDDMTLHTPLDYILDEPNYHISYCRNGFRKFVPDLWKKIHAIMAKENFDFLKLSFTEVYMDNNLQVSWYNVPQNIRSELWPDYDQLPISGLDYNCPRTNFSRIESHDDLGYIVGDVYYANWPMIVSREGNKKMFLDEKWAHPYEQTWMSYIFQETLKGNIKPAVLLASPIKHERIKHYKPEERREN